MEKNEVEVAEPSYKEISAVVTVINTWGGLRDRELDVFAIARRIIIAARKAAQAA